MSRLAGGKSLSRKAHMVKWYGFRCLQRGTLRTAI